jgi:hypothetical protein
MRPVVRVVLGALLVTWASTTPAAARVVNLVSGAPLSDHSDAAIDRAIETAVDTCVRQATALGLSWIWLHNAVVEGDSIVVHMVATDDESEGDGATGDGLPLDEGLKEIDVAPAARR